MNYKAVIGSEKDWNRLQHLRGKKAEILGGSEDGNGKGLDSGERQALKAINDEIWQLDPTMPFRQKMAIGFGKMTATGAPPGSRYNMEVDTDDMSFKDISEMAEAGDMGAAMVLKAVTGRKQFIKETLGRHYREVEDLIDDEKALDGSEGWTTWVPKPGSAWFKTNSLNDKLIENLIAGTHQLQPEDVKTISARGRDAQWVIPIELAEVLEGADFMKGPAENVVGKAGEEMLNWWKRWILINPMRVLKYNINNMSGDLDITLAYNPKILLHAKQATRDLYAQMKNRPMSAKLKEELRMAVRDGVIGSGMTVHDIPDIGKLDDFKRLMVAIEGENKNAISYIKKFWQGSKDYTTFRENILRLAAYRHFKAEIKAGKKVYAASDKAKVDATTDPDRRAALLSRELIGDYGNLSKGGQWLRRKMIPFYSWMEINAPRYWMLFKNLPNEGGSTAGGKARIAGVMAKKGTLLTLKATMLFAAIHAFNRLMWPDEEEELGASGRRQLHLILGRRSDGTIQTLRLQGALSDALAWVGLEDAPEDMRELLEGKKSPSDMIYEAVHATPNRLINAIRPDIKTPAEVLMGKTLYPDATKPRPIRDKVEHVARMFSLDTAYRRFQGRPSKERTILGKVLGDLQRTVTYTSDPGEASYFDARSMVFDFLDNQGIERGAADPTNRTNALYFYKQAIKYGDKEARDKYLNEYRQLGGNVKGLRSSIKRAHPLAAMPKKYRYRFLLSLDAKDRRTVNRAISWYNTTYLQSQ